MPPDRGIALAAFGVPGAELAFGERLEQDHLLGEPGRQLERQPRANQFRRRGRPSGVHDGDKLMVRLFVT